MADVNVRRSQAILRMPVDYVDATLILHDGDRAEVIFMLPRGEDVARLVSEGDAFIPVMRNARICIVARTAIACIGVPAAAAPRADDGLPVEKQRATVKLRSGMMIEGELRWTAPAGKERTADHLNNNDAPYVVVYATDTTYYVIKAHIATVDEK